MVRKLVKHQIGKRKHQTSSDYSYTDKNWAEFWTSKLRSCMGISIRMNTAINIMIIVIFLYYFSFSSACLLLPRPLTFQCKHNFWSLPLFGQAVTATPHKTKTSIWKWYFSSRRRLLAEVGVHEAEVFVGLGLLIPEDDLSWQAQLLCKLLGALTRANAWRCGCWSCAGAWVVMMI